MSVWKNIARWRQRKNKQRTKLRNKTRSMLMESLEPRQMLASLVVTSAADAGAGSLREAIATANSNSQADLIRFVNGITTVTLTSGELVLTETGAANKTTIFGPVTINGNNNSRIFNVQAGVFADLSYLTITKGMSADGAAILTNGELTITGSTIYDNESTGGASGLRIAAGATNIINSTLSNNRAAGDGGAIGNAGLLTVINSTITGNRADSDGNGDEFGGGITTAPGNGSTKLFNTIVAGNVRGAGAGTPDDLRGENVKEPSGNNLIGDAATAAGLTNGVNGNLVGNNASGVRDIATILDTTLKDNGGVTFTHALVANSPAINAGKSALIATSQVHDQLVKPRISGNGIYIGAFEFQIASSANSTFEVDGVLFVTTGDFTVTNPSATKQVRTTGGLVQIGLVPTVGSRFLPLLVLQSGVTITTDTDTGNTDFSTAGLVSAVTTYSFVNTSNYITLDLFAGIVDGDDTQRLVIPLKGLLTDGFVIDSKQANTLTN